MFWGINRGQLWTVQNTHHLFCLLHVTVTEDDNCVMRDVTTHRGQLWTVQNTHHPDSLFHVTITEDDEWRLAPQLQGNLLQVGLGTAANMHRMLVVTAAHHVDIQTSMWTSKLSCRHPNYHVNIRTAEAL